MVVYHECEAPKFNHQLHKNKGITEQKAGQQFSCNKGVVSPVRCPAAGMTILSCPEMVRKQEDEPSFSCSNQTMDWTTQKVCDLGQQNTFRA